LLAAVAAALLFTAACPPYEWWPAAWLVPALLLAPLRGRTMPFAAACGVIFGTIWGATMAGWMRDASLAYFGFDHRFAWAFTVGVALVYAGLPYGLLTALYPGIARRLVPGARALVGAWLWICSELLRSHLFTGLPWELLGHTQFRQLRLIQIADLGGAHLVSFLVAFVSLSLLEVLRAVRGGPARRAVVLSTLVPAGVALAGAWAYGGWCVDRYAGGPGPEKRVVAVVQGNIENAFRWKREFFEQTLLTYANLSLSLGAQRPDVIVWPENAVNFNVEREADLRPVLMNVAGAARSGFLFGGPRLTTDGRSFVSAYLMNPDGRIAGIYDKRRLLPFAEYDPFPRFGGGPIDGPIEFSPGEPAPPLASGPLRLGAVVCYEVLFPQLIRDVVRQGADVLVNIANDSWLDGGDGAAPRQHFSMVTFAAIAARRYLVRASASGISGFFDPYGRSYGLMARATAGVSLGEVAPRRTLTAYTRWGDAWIGVMGLLLGAAAWRRTRVREAADGRARAISR
jgi:apolipoprotein N-acyltransferase